MLDAIKSKLAPQKEHMRKVTFNLLCLALSWPVSFGFGRAFTYWNTGTDYSSHSVLYVALFVGAFFLLHLGLRVQGKQTIIAAAALGALFSAMLLLGRCLEWNNNITALVLDETGVFQSKLLRDALLQFVGCALLFYAALALLFQFCMEGKPKLQPHKGRWPFTGESGFFVIWAAIFLCWVPYFMLQYPGVVTYDTNMQIKQVLGILPWSNHHPVIDTLWKALFLRLGEALFGSLQSGLALLSCVQMCYMSAIFAFAVRYLARLQFHPLVPAATFLWFALFPVNGYYSVTHWKDQPFACMMLLLTMALAEIIRNREDFFKKAGNWFWLIGSMAGVMLWRNNGLYVLLLVLPLLLIFLKRVRIQLLIGFGCCALIFGLYKGPVFTALQVKEGSTAEAMSVPLQQLARVARDHWEELSEEDQAFYHSMFPSEENIGGQYNPRLSDPVKDRFDIEWFTGHKMEFLRKWVTMLPRYSLEYVEAFLSNSFGYWNPEVSYWVVDKGVYSDGLDIEHQTQLPKLFEFTDKLHWENMRQVPGISMLYSIGFHFWLLLIAAVLMLLKKRWAELLAFAPVFVLWLTCLASPVFSEFRYIYGMFSCLPVLLSLSLWSPERNVHGPLRISPPAKRQTEE